MVALEGLGRPKPSLFTRMSAGVIRHTVKHFPKLTTTVANSVGLIMTAPIARNIVKRAMGRDYDIGAARRIIFPNVDKDMIGYDGRFNAFVIRPEYAYGHLSVRSAFTHIQNRDSVTSWAEYRGGSHFYGGGWAANAYTLSDLTAAFFGRETLLHKLTPAILHALQGMREGYVPSESITAGVTRNWPK